MGIAVFLLIVILVLTWLLFTLPTPSATPVATTTAEKPVVTPPAKVTPPAEQPLSARVVVSSPKANTTVGSTFVAKGEAPGNWFFEASFPIQVRDKDGNVIGRTHANALGEWMTTSQVAFSATVNIEGGYTGPATLILMRDNPSGLPENDDSTEIPILIQ
jgi:hypothetical protein